MYRFCLVTSDNWQNRSPAERGPKSSPLPPFDEANYWRGLTACQTEKRKVQEIYRYMKIHCPLRNVRDFSQTIDKEEWLRGVIMWSVLCNGISGCLSNQMFELPEGMCCFPGKIQSDYTFCYQNLLNTNIYCPSCLVSVVVYVVWRSPWQV